MKLTRILAIAFSVVASGCAIQHPTRLDETYLGEMPAYSPSRQIQSGVFVVMTDEEQSRVHSSRAAYVLGSGSEFSFEIGKITKAVAEQVFGRAFAGGAKVITAPGQDPQVIFVHPSVKALEWWYRPTEAGYNYQEVVKLDLSVVIERNGQRVFDKTYSSGEVGGKIDKAPTPLGTEANRVVHQIVRRLMEQAANDFLAQR